MKNIEAIDELLASQPGAELKPDEFTLMDYMERAREIGLKLNLRTTRNKLCGMASSGELGCRKVLINGSVTNAYSKP